ncbi:hypothetical protein BAE44_0015838 [Dichanthelium oligosanthes]|uniref:DUF674 domain-containing protein n=1 Tax=Dichanthelium oligosanthes TaxID=888268 RepID=A0A1E5VDQ6_9POAL|nr:hypothetical protein BAE44_0015838 [Dichanthelium oligosanthes]
MAGDGSAGIGKIRVKFLVDREKNKVVFAESGKEFVDVLLSFLTLPLGTIVRLLGKESSLGCFDELYKSVESLDASHFQTKACRNMLLRPLSAAGTLYEDLVVRIDDTNHRRIWVCSQRECFTDTFYYSSVPDVPCQQRGRSLDLSWYWLDRGGGVKDDGVFVRGGISYATTDNLQVVPADTDNLMFVLRGMGIEDVTMLEEKTLEFGLEEIKILLKQMLKSDKPLTDLLFGPSDEPARADEPFSMAAKISSENGSSSDCDVLKVKLLVTKTDQSVVHAEVPEEFCNILFSFLTLPLGRVIELLGGSSSISSIDNLYRSVGENMTDYIKSDECRDMVLYPELPPFFSCSSPLLQSDEVTPIVSSVACCSPCIRNCSPFSPQKMKCSHGNTKVLAVNPKVPTMTTETSGSYAKGPGKFLVTNELGVAPFSLVNALHELKKKEHSVSNLATTEFTFTQVEVITVTFSATAMFAPQIYSLDNGFSAGTELVEGCIGFS